MPYRDSEKKLGHMKLWRKQKMSEGYGKWLYARRKLQFQDARFFREALERIVEVGIHDSRDHLMARSEILVIAQEAIRDSDQREAEVGPFEPPTTVVELPN